MAFQFRNFWKLLLILSLCKLSAQTVLDPFVSSEAFLLCAVLRVAFGVGCNPYWCGDSFAHTGEFARSGELHF